MFPTMVMVVGISIMDLMTVIFGPMCLVRFTDFGRHRRGWGNLMVIRSLEAR